MAPGSPNVRLAQSHTPTHENGSCVLGDVTLQALSDTTNLEDLKLFAPARSMYQCTTAKQHRIVVGVSLPDRFGARVLSIAIATDPYRSNASALTFSEALYDADEVFREIVRRADTHQPASKCAIIPFCYDQRFHYDHYSSFLRDFQHGIPLVEMVRGSRHIIDPKLEAQAARAGIEKKLRGQIAWILLECCRETIERTGSLLGTISALEFLSLMRRAGITDRLSARIAALIGNRSALAEPFSQCTARGFPKYVVRAAESFGGQVSRSFSTTNVPPRNCADARTTRARGINDQWNSGLIDPIFVA